MITPEWESALLAPLRLAAPEMHVLRARGALITAWFSGPAEALVQGGVFRQAIKEEQPVDGGDSDFPPFLTCSIAAQKKSFHYEILPRKETKILILRADAGQE